MGWVVVGAWIGAGVLALVILGFCAYEVTWKGKRLAADLQKLNAATAQVAGLQKQLADVQRRLADKSS